MQQLNDLWIFDTARQSWQLISTSSSGSNTMSPLPLPFHLESYNLFVEQPQGRSGGMACTDKESLWLYGGLSNSNGALSDFWHFEFTTRTWTLLFNGSYYPYVNFCMIYYCRLPVALENTRILVHILVHALMEQLFVSRMPWY